MPRRNASWGAVAENFEGAGGVEPLRRYCSQGEEREEQSSIEKDETCLPRDGLATPYQREVWQETWRRKSWRKLHLGLDLATGEIVCSDLTTDGVGDPTALPQLLDQIDGDVSRFIADGAYDGTPTSDLLVKLFGVDVEIIIPPPKTAVLSAKAAVNPTLRDQRISAIRTGGRMAWQVSSGYNQRSRAETQMGRWKMVIGPKLKARSFPNQRTEAKIGTHILNKMTGLGRAKFELIA